MPLEPSSVCAIFVNEPPSFGSLIAMSFVTSVMNAVINDPVARVPMNESTPITTTTTALTRPTRSAAPMPSATEPQTPDVVGDEVRGDDAAQGGDVADREVERARGERDDEAERDQARHRVVVQHLPDRVPREELVGVEGEEDDDQRPDVDGADVAWRQRPHRALAEVALHVSAGPGHGLLCSLFHRL